MAGATVWNNAAQTGDLNTAGNYTNGVPSATETPAIWDQTNSDSVTAGMSDLTAVNVPEIIFNPGYTGDIGSSGAPLDIHADKITFRGAGRLFFKNGDSSADTDDLILDAPSSPLMQIGCVTAGITRIAALNGPVTLDATLTGTADLYVGAGAIVTIEGANAITNVFVDRGGQVKACNVPITTLYMLGGRMLQNRDGGRITTIVMGGDAYLDYQAATGPALAIVGGTAVLDFGKDGREKTVTAARVFKSGRIKMSHSLIITTGEKYLDGLTGLN